MAETLTATIADAAHVLRVADVMIDFSAAAGLQSMLQQHREELAGKVLVVGTTGLNDEITAELSKLAENSPVIVPDGTPPTPYETSRYIPTAHPGHRAPHAWLSDGTPLFNHFGRGFTLLVLGPREVECSGLEHAAYVRGAPLTILRRSEPELRELYQANLVLIRPDQHVGWRSDTEPEDPGAVIDVLRGAAPQTMRQ